MARQGTRIWVAVAVAAGIVLAAGLVGVAYTTAPPHEKGGVRSAQLLCCTNGDPACGITLPVLLDAPSGSFPVTSATTLRMTVAGALEGPNVEVLAGDLQFRPALEGGEVSMAPLTVSVTSNGSAVALFNSSRSTWDGLENSSDLFDTFGGWVFGSEVPVEVGQVFWMSFSAPAAGLDGFGFVGCDGGDISINEG